MELLWAKYDVPFPLKDGLPEEWDPLQAHGHAIAGTPAQVRDYIAGASRGRPARPISSAISPSARSRHEEVMRSVELFAREVMPAFADA